VAQLLKLEAMGYRTAQGRFSKRTDELAAQMRNETRDLSRSMVSTLEYYAPKDKGIFAEGIRFRTVWKGDRVESTNWGGRGSEGEGLSITLD
jgi:hypothetical protein